MLNIVSLATPPPAPARTAPVQTAATTPDGVRIAIQESGDPKGPEILFVHGLYGSHLNWERQIASPHLRRYRLVTYDLRGHGLSGKPTDPRAYRDGRRWGEELATVIRAKGLRRPVVVGWSMGGAVITNYLGLYGDAHLAGLVFVDGVVELRPEFLRNVPATTAAMTSTDMGRYLDGTRAFLRQCFFRPPAPAAFERMVQAAAMASPDMVRAVYAGLSIPAATALPKVAVPTLFVFGARDGNLTIGMLERGRRLVPRSKALIYPATGHAAFYERAERFDRDLDRFVRRSRADRPTTRRP